jgi:hypothetical protein
MFLNIILGSHDRTLSIYDLRSPVQPEHVIQNEGYVFSCVFSDSGKFVAIGVGNPDYNACTLQLSFFHPNNSL